MCNPPFAGIEKWLLHALSLATGSVAVFARLALLEGVARGRLFRSTPLSRVWVHSGRVPCPPGEQAPPLDAWSRTTITGGYTGDPRLGLLPLERAGDRQGELLRA